MICPRCGNVEIVLKDADWKTVREETLLTPAEQVCEKAKYFCPECYNYWTTDGSELHD